MDFVPEIAFRNMPEISGLRRCIENRARQLGRRFWGIKSCRVTIELPYHHRYAGNIYNFQIEVCAPGGDLIVTRLPSADGSEANVYALFRDAFAEMDRKLRACACAPEGVAA